MKNLRVALFLFVACFLASCSNIRPLSSKPPYSLITVNKPFTWGDGVILIKVEMPAGEYKPLYEDDKGYYYQAPQKVTGRDSFWPLLMDGGLFLKRNMTKPDQLYIIRNQYGIPTRVNIGDRADVTTKP